MKFSGATLNRLEVIVGTRASNILMKYRLHLRHRDGGRRCGTRLRPAPAAVGACLHERIAAHFHRLLRQGVATAIAALGTWSPIGDSECPPSGNGLQIATAVLSIRPDLQSCLSFQRAPRHCGRRRPGGRVGRRRPGVDGHLTRSQLERRVGIRQVWIEKLDRRRARRSDAGINGLHVLGL